VSEVETSELRPGEIKIEGLGKRYCFRSLAKDADDADTLTAEEDEEEGYSFARRRRVDIWALRDVTCQIQPGERVAIVGANGSGKSTLIRILSRTLPPSEGMIEGAGIVIPFAALKSPLNPHMSGIENLRMLARLLNIPSDHFEERLPELIEFSELGLLAREKVTRYSSRSFARLSMAMGLFVDAHIYLVDDDVKVGDDKYRAKFMARYVEKVQSGVTLIYASNNLGLMRAHCQRGILLQRGKMVADGDVDSVLQQFLMYGEDLNGAQSPAARVLGNLEKDEEERVEPLGEDRVEKEHVSGPGVAPLKTCTLQVVAPEQLEPLNEWAEAERHAEAAWQGALEKLHRTIEPNENASGGTVKGTEGCSYAELRGVRYLNGDGARYHALPSETLVLELQLETFTDAVEVSVRLELQHKGTLVLVAEPLLPFTALIAGAYIVRVELPGDMLGHANALMIYQIVTRVLFKAKNSSPALIIARCPLKLKGHVRFAFEAKRAGKGFSATSIVKPTPPFLGWQPSLAPETDEGGEDFDRDPALRPRLKWAIYRIVTPQTADAEESTQTSGADKLVLAR
jgi:ABC-2 type transport system ATP-binding protein